MGSGLAAHRFEICGYGVEGSVCFSVVKVGPELLRLEKLWEGCLLSPSGSPKRLLSGRARIPFTLQGLERAVPPC